MPSTDFREGAPSLEPTTDNHDRARRRRPTPSSPPTPRPRSTAPLRAPHSPPGATRTVPLLGRLTTWAAWNAWRDLIVEHYRRQGPDCPLAAVTHPLGRNSPAARAVVARLIEQWQSELASGIRAMQATGAMPADRDARRTAAAIIAGVQGGVVMLVSTGRTEHLEAVLELEFAALAHHSDAVVPIGRTADPRFSGDLESARKSR